MQRNVAHLLHAVRNKPVTGGGKKGHSRQYQILAKRHWAIPYALAGWMTAVESSFSRLDNTHLLRAARSFMKDFASLYNRFLSTLLNIAFLKMRNTALGRK